MPRERHNLISEDGKVRVQAEKCATCIFRSGNLMHLRPGRVSEMVAEVKEMDGCIPCHETLEGDEQAVCRGQFDKHKTMPLQVAERLDEIEFVKEDGDE